MRVCWKYLLLSLLIFLFINQIAIGNDYLDNSEVSYSDDDNGDNDRNLLAYSEIFQRLSKSNGYTSELPAISQNVLENALLNLSFDKRKFYEFVYLKLLVGIELKTLLDNLCEVVLFSRGDDSEYLKVVYGSVLHLIRDFPEINDEFLKLIEREIALNKNTKEKELFNQAIIKLEDMLRAHYETLKDLSQNEVSINNLPQNDKERAKTALAEHKNILQNKLPIANFDSIKEYFHDNPNAVSNTGKYDDLLHSRIDRALKSVMGNIQEEFSKGFSNLVNTTDYLESDFLKEKLLPDLNLMSIIVDRYEFLESGWQSLMLVKMKDDRRRNIINGTIVCIGMVSTIFASKIVGLFGLTAEATFVLARGVALFGDFLFAQYFCRMAIEYYFDYKTAERRAYTSVVDQGLVNIAEIKELRVRFYRTAIVAGISLGLSAFEVARLLRNPAFGIILRNEVKPTLLNMGRGAYKSIRGDKLITNAPSKIVDQYGNAYIKTVEGSERVGYYLVKPIGYLKDKGWSFLKTLRVEVPKGAIYGATGALLGYFFYERLNASAFAVVTFTKGLLGIKPNSREISSSIRDTTKIIRSQMHEGIYDVNGMIFSIRDWESRKDLIIIKMHLGIIKEDEYNTELREIDEQIKIRLYDFGRRYHDYIESRQGMMNQLRKFNIELTEISKSQFRISYHGLVVIYDAMADNSSMPGDFNAPN